jgi:hypothetical protein
MSIISTAAHNIFRVMTIDHSNLNHHASSTISNGLTKLISSTSFRLGKEISRYWRTKDYMSESRCAGLPDYRFRPHTDIPRKFVFWSPYVWRIWGLHGTKPPNIDYLDKQFDLWRHLHWHGGNCGPNCARHTNILCKSPKKISPPNLVFGMISIPINRGSAFRRLANSPTFYANIHPARNIPTHSFGLELIWT